MIMCVLCSWQVSAFLLAVIPWEPQHDKFSVITFIVIIGCFSSCIKARHKIFLSYFEQVNDFELSGLKIKKTSCCIPEKFISVTGIIKHLMHMS